MNEPPTSVPPGALHYASGPVPMPSRRPTSVTVIAILGIIFGGLGTLGGICALPQYLGLKLIPNPVQDAMVNDMPVRLFMLVTIGLGLILAIIELVAAIGALQLRPSAREWLVRYAIATLVIGVGGLLINVAYLHSRVTADTDAALAKNPNLNTPQFKTIRTYSTYGGYCFAVLWWSWPICILYFMTRPAVKQAFDAEPAPPSSTAFGP